MSELDQNRFDFIECLHEVFLMKKGRGAFAYISISDAVSLFHKHLDSNESTDRFIDKFVRSVLIVG